MVTVTLAEETRQRVVQEAKEMGYEPSYAARQLRRKRTDAIGYILPTHPPSLAILFTRIFWPGCAMKRLNSSTT
jgi:DNA-binding LacI/PurR family transcriptional regulator